MPGPRTLLIVNPMSQNGALGRRWPELSLVARRRLGSFEEAFTSGPNDATRLCREALSEGVERVVAIGGDGTINEVANGFFENGEAVVAKASMGILPYGTGGDFRKSVGIPKDFEKALEILARGKCKSIDLGNLEYTQREGGTAQRIFVNIASFGISGEIDERVNSSSKRLGGKLTFMLATARVAMSYQSKRVRVVFDDDEASAIETNINTIAVANGGYFGGGMFIAPHARVDDGLFDVVAVGDSSFMSSMLNAQRLYKGTHLELKHVSERRAISVHAEPMDDQDVVLDVDGEAPGILPATFRILPKALRLVVP